MKPIDPAELSAHLDGELSPTRAREVEVALANNPTLQAELDALAEADGVWQAAADSAIFEPVVRLRRRRMLSGSRLGIAAILGVLVVLRILPKFSDALEWGLLLHSVALAIILAWVARMARQNAIAADT